MQREIKFRALCDVDCKDESSIKMVYFGLPEMDNGLWSFPIDENIVHINGYESPLMQYIGLNDKNGISIYEGDIIKTHWQHDGTTNYDYEIIGEIKYNENRSQFCIENSECVFPLYSFEREQFMGRDNDNEIEILGNIYDNTELVNEKELTN